MTNELQQPSLESSEGLPIASDVISPQPKKSNKNLWIILGVIAVVLSCCVTILAVAGLGLVKTKTEKAPIESVLDSYMKYMEAKDAESAYALFSPRTQRNVPISKMEELLEGNNYFLFKDYQSISVQNLNISTVVNNNPDNPQGIVAKVTGTIEYEGGIQGTFNSTLERVEKKWRIDIIYITIPPDKMGSDMSLSLDGTLSAVPSGNVNAYNIVEAQFLPDLQIPEPQSSRGWVVAAIAFSDDGGLIAAGLGDGTICIFRTIDSKLLYHFRAYHEAYYNGAQGLSFSPDNTLLASSGYDGLVKLWGIAR